MHSAQSKEHGREHDRRDSAAENMAPAAGPEAEAEVEAEAEADVGMQGPAAGHECSICLNWLKEPLLTSCGHRFCAGCIRSWLKRKKYCPIDNAPLDGDADLFPDNYTRREIHQKRMTCPNRERGCPERLIPFDVESHAKVCPFRSEEPPPPPPQTESKCLFGEIGCDATFPTRELMERHAASEMRKHLELLADAYSKLNLDRNLANAAAAGEEAVGLWDPKDKRSDGENSNLDISFAGLMRTLYERIVFLEQKNREWDIRMTNLDRLTRALSADREKTTEELALRHCMGTYAWRIDDFRRKLSSMRSDPSAMFYSPAFYTLPNGYRFCARLNLSPVRAEFLALHVHLMKSENDVFLNWPFSGKISLMLINADAPRLTLRDTMMANPTLGAFQRPTVDFCPKGFGLAEYVAIDDLENGGFISDDRLTIVIKIQTV